MRIIRAQLNRKSAPIFRNRLSTIRPKCSDKNPKVRLKIPADIKRMERELLSFFQNPNQMMTPLASQIFRAVLNQFPSLSRDENIILQIQISCLVSRRKKGKVEVNIHPYPSSVFTGNEDMFGRAFEVWGAPQFLKGVPDLRLTKPQRDKRIVLAKEVLNGNAEFLETLSIWNDACREHNKGARRLQFDLYSIPIASREFADFSIPKPVQRSELAIIRQFREATGFTTEFCEDIILDLIQEYPKNGSDQRIVIHGTLEFLYDSQHPQGDFTLHLGFFDAKEFVTREHLLGHAFASLDDLGFLLDATPLKDPIDVTIPLKHSAMDKLAHRPELITAIKNWAAACRKGKINSRNFQLNFFTYWFQANK